MSEGGGGRGDSDKARDEFFNEAQELVDALGRDLLVLDEGLNQGKLDPELINDVFRHVHTLKGLSGLFGATRMAGLSHQLEDALDDLRLGRIELTKSLLDLLFRAVSLYTRLLAAEKTESAQPAQDVDDLLFALGRVLAAKDGVPARGIAQYDLDPSLFGVLTEYEEHRLRQTLQEGLTLVRIRVRFALATIDSALEDLKSSVKGYGEIITYLPSDSGGDAENIDLEILMASAESVENLRELIRAPNVVVEEIRRRSDATGHPAPPAAATPQSHLGAGGPTRRRPSSAPFAPASGGSSVRPPRKATGALSSAPGKGSPELSLRSITQTVRVDIRKLDRLMTVVGELAIVRTALARLSERARRRSLGPREFGLELQRMQRAFERQLGQMQSGILEVRMVPLGQSFDKLARIVRQISREHGKEVKLVVTGAETEIDKLIVEELSDPLMHIIRNAIDHGIEMPEARARVGKPSVGTIALNAFQKGNHVVIEVEDDGAGMDPAALLSAAVQRGLLRPAEALQMSPRDALALVFTAGFTTRLVATDLSGRGVGLDVVKTNIGKLGGVVDIASDIGIGTKITITLPITLAIINVLLVEVGSGIFAIPLASVEEAIALDETQVRSVESREILTVRGATLPLCRLDQLFRIAPPPAGARAFVVVVRLAERRLGLVVRELVGQQDIVIKPLGKSIAGTRGFAGATELGDQRVALVLDVGAIIEEELVSADSRFFLRAPAEDSAPESVFGRV
jgi:two-component system chemotaxis sensor kinase CheA